MARFNKGDWIAIAAYKSAPGEGLRYSAQTVRASESGCAGGWDVFDATDAEGDEVSFYGFSVLKIVPGDSADAAAIGAMLELCKRQGGEFWQRLAGSLNKALTMV